MISDVDLQKIKIRAQKAIDDNGRGLVITLAMDPVVMFNLAAELLKLRKLQQVVEETWENSRNELPR